MKAQQIESTPEEDRGRETVAYPARDEEDLEQILEQAHTVEDEETAEAVENINQVVDDELRGVVRNHFQAPIRSLNNPEETSVELQEEYRSDDNTILSNPEAVEAFNKLLQDQEPPTKETQVVGEEYFVNQNLPGFQDVGNIKWWTVYDDGTYREETRNDRGGEHLNFDRDGELHGFHVELDGEPLDPEQTQRLARNLQTRRDNRVTTRSGTPISELSDIPEMVLEHNNITEAVEASEDYDRERFESEYEEAQELGLVTGEGNLTLKGWLSAVDMEARDVRAIEDVARGSDTVEFESEGDLGFDLEPSRVRGRANIEASNQYIRNRGLHSPTEEGEIDLDENEYSDNLQEFLLDYCWMGFNPKSSPIEPQQVEAEMPLSQYLREFEDAEIEMREDGEFRVGNDDARNWIFRQLASNATNRDSGVTITNTDIDYELELSIDKVTDGEVDTVSAEESDIPDYLLEEVLERTRESMEFHSGTELFGESEFGTVGEKNSNHGTSTWRHIFDYDDTVSTEFEDRITDLTPLQIYLSKHEEEIEALKEGYEAESDYRTHDIIPEFFDASEELQDSVQELEELGWISTEVRPEKRGEVEVTASDPLELRQVIDQLSEIEGLNYPNTEYNSWKENERVPLDSVYVEIEAAAGEEEIRERLETHEEELLEEISCENATWSGWEGSLIEEKLEWVQDYERDDGVVHKLNEYAHEKSDSEMVKKLFGKVLPEPREVPGEEVPNYEEMRGYLDYENDRSEELLDTLGELYEEGLIDVEIDHDVEYDRESTHDPIPDRATISDYHELEEETKEELRELDKRGMIELEEASYHLEMHQEDVPEEYVEIGITGEAEATELEVEDTTVEFEGEYETTDDTIYEANQELQRIADNLDPLNFEKDSYEDIEVETDFEYSEVRQPAAV